MNTDKYIFEKNLSELPKWIQREVTFKYPTRKSSKKYKYPIRKGSTGKRVKRVAEWLNLHDCKTPIRSYFSETTKTAVKKFQRKNSLDDSGVVDEETFNALVKPMRDVLRQRLNSSVSPQTALVEYARAHLESHPMEVGGSNRGPWVRLYMQGYEGSRAYWCAGFVTFLLEQATQSLGIEMPIEGSPRCSTLASQAKRAKVFLSESEVDVNDLSEGAIFLVRKSSRRWSHTGIVTHVNEDSFNTIEGNTEDDGNREGYEVCALKREYSKKDFIIID